MKGFVRKMVGKSVQEFGEWGLWRRTSIYNTSCFSAQRVVTCRAGEAQYLGSAPVIRKTSPGSALSWGNPKITATV